MASRYNINVSFYMITGGVGGLIDDQASVGTTRRDHDDGLLLGRNPTRNDRGVDGDPVRVAGDQLAAEGTDRQLEAPAGVARAARLQLVPGVTLSAGRVGAADSTDPRTRSSTIRSRHWAISSSVVGSIQCASSSTNRTACRALSATSCSTSWTLRAAAVPGSRGPDGTVIACGQPTGRPPPCTASGAIA